MAAAERIPAVERMIESVARRKGISHAAAVEYMLAIAAGRLHALRRYGRTLPTGKRLKGVYALVGRKRPAAKSRKLTPYASEEPAAAAAKPAARVRKPRAKSKRKSKSKSKSKKSRAVQLELPATEAAAKS